MSKNVLFFSIVVLLTLELQGQSTNIPLDADTYHIIDRFDIKGGNSNYRLKTGFKAYRRIDVVALLDSLEIDEPLFSSVDQFNYTSLLNDNWERASKSNHESSKPFLNRFYRSKADFYHVDIEDFDLHINPVLYLSVGSDNRLDATPFINTRGIELRGTIGKKLGFYSFLGENQATFPGYVNEFVNKSNAVPHEGFWKDFKKNGVDFFTARGYIDFTAAKYINLQFGHDRFKVGDGFRSLILSNFSNNYLFLKVNTKIWRISYTNLYTQMTADNVAGSTGSIGNRRFPEKFMSLHRLGIDLTPNINIGLFEAVIFGDSTRQGYDLNYLNPIIFYRAIEQQNGSADNALVGMDLKVNIAKRYSLYGQFVFDEFKLDQFTAGTGWWANKYAVQIGAKYLDILGLSNLDLQVEGNLARPYIYSHRTRFTNYAHYGQALAHPLGANFKELVIIGRFQPIPKLAVTAKFIMAEYGSDTLDSNWGGNIFRSFNEREMDFNNETAQGVSNNLRNFSFSASYQLKHNLFIDVEHTSRKNDNIITGISKTSYTALSIRLNIPKRLHDF